MELRQYSVVIKRWWWLMLAATVVAAVSSFFAISRVPRVYQSTATVMIGQVLQKANPTNQDLYISQQLAQTYANMVSRRPVLQTAAEELGLPYVPWAGNISARTVPGTQLLEISVRDTDPRRARALADEIVRQLIRQSPTESGEDRDRQVFVQTQLQKLEASIQTTGRQIEDEQTKLDTANSARAIEQYQNNIAALQQRLASYQSTYASLLQTVQGGTNYISVVEPATMPVRPISPRVMETVLLAGTIGLALALGGAFLIEFLDDTVKTRDDVARTVDLPTLGAIPPIRGKEYEEKLITAWHPRSSIAEAYRALRTNIQFSSVDTPIRTLLVTSPSPFEGKSVTVANLAMVMAQSGRSVVIVDADLRRPVQHRIFGLSNHDGLSKAILESDASVSECMWRPELESLLALSSDGEGERVAERAQVLGIGNLHVIPSGPLPPNPADLLGSERMGAFIEKLKNQADMVLFDCPPVLAVSDTAVLSTRVDGVLLVSDVGHTRRAMVRQSVERLHQVNANVLGVVLNRLVPRRGGYYAGQYYSGEAKNEWRKDGTRPQQRSWKSVSRLLLGKIRLPGNHRRQPTQPHLTGEPGSRTQ